jgi:hypothetical protein
MKVVKLLGLLAAAGMFACEQSPTQTMDNFAPTVTGPGPIIGTAATPSPEEIDVCKVGPAGNVNFTLTQTGPDPANPLSDDGADGAATIAAGTCERVAFNGGDRDTVKVTEIVPAGQQLDSIKVQQLTPGGTTTTKLTGVTTASALITGGGTAGEGAVITFYNSLVFVPGDEGCTPGFWKNHAPEAWAGTGLTPGQLVGPLFIGELAAIGSLTLLEALDGGGGPDLLGAQRILIRAAVAALLNAASPNVDYSLSTAQVIALVNAALASGDRDTILEAAADLDEENNLGCPL